MNLECVKCGKDIADRYDYNPEDGYCASCSHERERNEHWYDSPEIWGIILFATVAVYAWIRA